VVSPQWERDERASGTEEAWSLAIGPRVGFDVPISRFFSFYPQAELLFGALGLQSTKVGNAVGVLVAVNAYAPLLLHLAPHFFMGFGPTVFRDLAIAGVSQVFVPNLETQAGVATSVGGWL